MNKKKFVHICPGPRTSLRETSYDSAHDEFMTDSSIAVINFDHVKTCYMNKYNHSEEDAKSVDALARGIDDMLYMIEFKNGKCKAEAADIRLKIKDSLLILCDICKRRLNDAREEIIFVLVINSSRAELTQNDICSIIYGNKSSASSFCGLDKIAGVFVKKVLIYDRDELKIKLLPKLKDI